MPAFRALIVLLALLAAVTAVRSQPLPAAEVPMQSVALFSSGVGYFEHGGQIEGDRIATLHFTEDRSTTYCSRSWRWTTTAVRCERWCIPPTHR